MYRKLSGIIVCAALGCALSGCTLLDYLNDKAKDDVVGRTLDVIDRGIAEIDNNSAAWREALEKIAHDLPQDASELVRNDIQNLVDRSVATAGTELRCDSDFYGQRVVQALQGIKAELQGKTPPPREPAFCQVSPAALDMSANQGQWSDIRLSGYDLDGKDASGRAVEILLLDSAGTLRRLPDSRVGRTTHYELTVNLAGMASELYSRHVVKVLARWGGQPLDRGEVVVKKWLPRTQEKPVPASTLSYHPPHTKGDGDFDTHDDEPMNVRVKAEVTWDASSLRGRVFMSAREPRPDYTTAEGTTEWRTLFTAPAHWKITSVTPTSAAELNVNINDHGVKQYGLGAGEVAQSFEVAGDRDGDEAGSWTGVNVFWREFRVQLEESEPDWLNPSYTAEATDL